MEERIFSYEEAADLIPAVREKTAAAAERLGDLRQQMDKAVPHSSRARKLGEWINTVINQWAEDIMALGALPKGLWTVDFDSGEGFYFCWTHDEASLTHFHPYKEGFASRKPLAEKDGQPPPALLN